MMFKSLAMAAAGVAALFTAAAAQAASMTCGSEGQVKDDIAKIHENFEASVSMDGDNGIKFEVFNSKDKTSEYPTAVIARYADGTVCITPAPRFMKPEPSAP